MKPGLNQTHRKTGKLQRRIGNGETDTILALFRLRAMTQILAHLLNVAPAITAG